MRARVARRRGALARIVERAAVPERPVVCRGPLFLVHPAVTSACAGSLQRIAVLLRDESHPIDPSLLGALRAFVCDGASPFFGRDAAVARRELAQLERHVEDGRSAGTHRRRQGGRGGRVRRAPAPEEAWAGA